MNRFWIVLTFFASIAFAALPSVGFAATSTTNTTTTPIISEATASNSKGSAQEGIYERGRVENVGLKTVSDSESGQQVEAYHVKFLSGPLKGQTRDILSDVGSNPYNIQPRVGDTLVLFMQASEGDWQIYVEGFDRQAAIIWLIILFVFVLVLLSGWQGVKVALSIVISIALIGYVLIPLFLKGVNPVPVAIILSGIFTLISTGFSTGWNRKTYVTAIGTMGGALTAYGVALLFANWAHLSGLSTEEDRLFFDKNPLLNAQGLLFAGIIIAAAGVVEDVAVSIVSGASEVKRANPRANFRQLFEAGMVIGKDHMGALANTLVFAYVGGSLSTLLLYQQFGSSWLKFANFDGIVDEVIRSLAGTIGLVFTVPITALLAAWVMQNAKKIPPSETHLHTSL